MKIINESGTVVPTLFLDDNGTKIEGLFVTKMNIDFTIGEPVSVDMIVLSAKVAIEVLPENINLYADIEPMQSLLDDLVLEKKEYTKTDRIVSALKYILGEQP